MEPLSLTELAARRYHNHPSNYHEHNRRINMLRNHNIDVSRIRRDHSNRVLRQHFVKPFKQKLLKRKRAKRILRQQFVPKWKNRLNQCLSYIEAYSENPEEYNNEHRLHAINCFVSLLSKLNSHQLTNIIFGQTDTIPSGIFSIDLTDPKERAITLKMVHFYLLHSNQCEIIMLDYIDILKEVFEHRI